MLMGAALLAGMPAPAAAQQRPREAPPTTQPEPQGLDALDEDRVMTEIAGRGMAELLKHAFDKSDVPEHRRRFLLARISLNRLQGKQQLSTVERRELVRDVIANVQQTVEESKDAQLLFEQAQLLITRGVDEETRLLEYFGDNPSLREYLLPVTEGTALMLERAAQLFGDEADKIANRITGPNDPAAKAWEQADAVTQRVRDYRVFADYNRILSLPPGDPQRLTLADALIENVKAADNEKNPRRTFVQAYLGKVALARGNEKGLAMARDYLEQVLAASSDEKEIFDAHYFRTVTEIQDRDFAEARAQLARFEEWFAKQAMPDRRPLMMVLEYRLEDAAAQYGPVAQRGAAEARASKLLVDLVEQHEEYRSIVTEQLLSRIEAKSDLAAMPPLLLDALVDRGRAEAAVLAQRQAKRESGLTTGPAAATGPEADIAVIERGIAAAEELARRSAAGDVQVDPASLARNAFLRGLMLDILGRKLEAAEAFVAFEQVKGAEAQHKIAAFRRALGIIEDLKSQQPDRATLVRIDALEGRLLPLLVGPPVNDKSRAFDLANRLHRLGQLEEAAGYYRQVPPSDPRAIDAAYLLVLAENARLAEMNPSSPRRAAVAHELPRLGEQALAQLQDAMSKRDGEARQAYRERVARVKVILARLAMAEDRDAQKALLHLIDIEEDVEGLSEAEEILSAALPLRFQATAMAGKIDEATADLLALLERSDAQRGLSYIAQFRETLNRAMREAEQRGDDLAKWQLMQTRAAVTPRLVRWIEQKNDPEYQKYVYNFRRFDAETQHQAALLATDKQDRATRLRRALDAYKALGSADNLARYRELLESLSPEERSSVDYDRDVVFAVASIHYELGEYDDARSFYGRLLADRALGNATKTVQQDGTARQVPNDEFWELHLKFMRANLKLGNPPEPMRQQLRNLDAVYGDSVGGNAWRGEFAVLKAELLSGEPATRPAASR